MSAEIKQMPFLKQLVANDKRSRDAALDSLRTFLSGRRELPPIELLKLWKGLFYCLWMCDRPLAQQALANSLAQLIFVLPLESVIPFLRAFWQTMQREWTNIDVLRMEKFLLLTRRYLGVSLGFLSSQNWNRELIDQMLQLLTEIPCNTMELTVPNGMRYHVIDIYVDEMERLGLLTSEHDALVETLLEPLRKLAKESPTKIVRTKAKEALKDTRLLRANTESFVSQTDS